MADKKKKLDYDLAFTHLQNNQNITAYNLFLNLAENQKKIDTLKSAVLFILAGECKHRQNKDNANEILEAGKSFLNFEIIVKQKKLLINQKNFRLLKLRLLDL